MNLRWLALIFLTTVFSAHATDLATIEAHGTVFYKMPAGDMVTRNVSLILPVMGEGKVFLKGGNLTLPADRYFTVHTNGRVSFYIIFSNFPGAKEGQIAIYRGTYVRGTNLARYYGDVFLSTNNDDDHSIVTTLDTDTEDRYTYIAGFSFEAPVLSSFGPR